MSDTPGWMDRIAHDLRGPLMPLQTAVQLLRSGQLEPARQLELLDVIDRQSRQLTGMISELDDWARACQGRLLGRREPIEPALLLDAASVGAKVPLAAIDDTAEGAAVLGDQQRLTQLFRVLLGFLASSGGQPAARVRAREGWIDVDLHADDMGPAIDALLEQPQVPAFDGGLGLQLLIARAIAEGHGGSLAAAQDGATLHLRCELPRA